MCCGMLCERIAIPVRFAHGHTQLSRYPDCDRGWICENVCYDNYFVAPGLPDNLGVLVSNALWIAVGIALVVAVSAGVKKSRS